MAHLIACPECKKHLQVPDTLVGKKVQCPECKNTFTADVPEEIEVKTGTTAKPSPPPLPKTPAWDEDATSDDDAPVKKKKKRYRDDDDDRDDDDEDLPRRSRRVRRSTVPHRGGMILAFGIIGIVAFPLVFSIIAWVMGNKDLREIRAGRMDSDGEGMTQAGRILGIIGTVLGALYLFGCVGYVGCIAVVFGLAGAKAKGGFAPPPRKF